MRALLQWLIWAARWLWQHLLRPGTAQALFAGWWVTRSKAREAPRRPEAEP